MDTRPHPLREVQQKRARELVVPSELAQGTLREYEGALR
jgi:hypothetical protein